MDVLATCHANSVLLAIALVAAPSACDSSTSANASPTPSGPVEPASNDVSPVSPPAPQAIDADIARFVSNDAVVRMERRGDLDGDGNQDVLLVLQDKAQAESAPRTLMILRGAADGSLEKVVENPDAILCQSCGGMMGDPLSGVEIHAGGFVLAFEGGSRELWSRTYRFAYSQTRGDWHLERIDMKMLDRIDGREEASHATREQIGTVSITDFDAASVAQDQGI